MIARPLVAGPVAGLVLGDPVNGMWVGVVLEVLTLYQLPIGASRHWDTGPASIAAVTTLVAMSGGAERLLIAAMLGALVGWAGSWSIHMLRHLNSRFVVVGEEVSADPALAAVGHITALGLDFARAVALTLVGLLASSALAHWLPAGPTAAWAAGLLLLACVSLAMGADVRAMVGGRRILWPFGVAAVVSGIVVLWLV